MTKISHDSEILAEGQQVITVCALIYHNFEGVKKVFMPRRAATKKFLPNVYELPGGHVDFGEELIPALLREIHEEFEIDITVEEPFAAFTYLNEIKKSQSVEIIYTATLESPLEAITLHAEDHSEYIWIAQNELHKIMTPTKQMDDPEVQAIQRGFQIINKK